jgi:transposase
MNVTRIYKYSLQPTPSQRVALQNIGIKSRILWNKLCEYTFWAIKECENGRRASIINEYEILIKGKKLTGQRAAKVNELSETLNISKDKALEQFVKQKVEKDTTIARRKDNTRYLRYSNKHLARLYAAEKVNVLKDNILKDGSSQVWFGILQKWDDFCKAWEKGDKGNPKFKKYNQMSAIQKQITVSSNFTIGDTVNLAWCGSECLSTVKVIMHRSLPTPSTIKQIALVKDAVDEWHICVFIEAEKMVFARKFADTGKIVGIDPNMSLAFVTSDAEIIHPKGISKDRNKRKKIKKLQRKLDNQTRINNPHCYNDDGTWKRGKKITVRTKGMISTAIEIAKIKKYYKDAKADYYHNTAIKLLNEYDVIGIGKTQVYKLVSGKGKLKRAQNSKVRENANSEFITKLEDKANLSLTTKHIYSNISEYNTTKKCWCCGHINNSITLDTKEWTCSNCNTFHKRDVTGAINIRTNTISFHNEMMKMSAAQAVNGVKTSKVRRSTKVRKTQSPRSTETIKPQGDGTKQEALVSVQVVAQINKDSSNPPSVTEHDTKVESSVDSAPPLLIVGHSQSQPCITVI